MAYLNRIKTLADKVLKMRFLKLFLFGIIPLFLIVLSAGALASQPENIMFISLNFKDNILTLNDLSRGEGYTPQFLESPLECALEMEKASLMIYSENGKLLYSSEFYIENKAFRDFVNEETGELYGGITELNDVNFTVTAPYFESIGKIKIISDYNSIAVEHVEITKIIEIPKADGTAQNDEADSDEDYESTDSFLLKFIGIIEDIYSYIFG